MLKINLLPEEKRKVEKTPVPRFMLIIAEAVVLTLVAIGCTLYIIKLKSLESQEKDAEKELAELKIRVEECNRKAEELAQLQEQDNQINQVVSRPFSYAEMIDNIWDVVSNNNNKKIWLEKVEFIHGSAEGELKKAYPTFNGRAERAVVLKCKALGTDLNVMTNFRKDLKQSQKISNMFNIINIAPDYKIDSSSISFDVSLVRAK